MHYTFPENIHKVIDPLFLDELKQELTDILEDTSLGERARRNRLERYHDKIASLTFFEHADGSRTSLSIRHLSAALILFGARHTFWRYPLRALFATRSKHLKPARTPTSTPDPNHARSTTNPSNSLFYLVKLGIRGVLFALTLLYPKLSADGCLHVYFDTRL